VSGKKPSRREGIKGMGILENAIGDRKRPDKVSKNWTHSPGGMSSF
jgi:hypothetical protein